MDDNVLKDTILGIIKGYLAIGLGSLQMKAARGRLQPWQASQACTRMVSDVTDMYMQAQNPVQSFDVDAIVNGVAAKLDPSKQIPATVVEEQVEDKVGKVEKYLNDNPEVVKQILAKV